MNLKGGFGVTAYDLSSRESRFSVDYSFIVRLSIGPVEVS